MAFILEAIRARLRPAPPNPNRIYVKLLPIKVEAIVEEGDDINLRAIIDMRNFCREKNISFEARLYAPRNHDIDCDITTSRINV